MRVTDENDENQHPTPLSINQKLKPNNKISVNKPQQPLAQSPKPTFHDPLIQSYEFKIPTQQHQTLEILNRHESHRNS